MLSESDIRKKITQLRKSEGKIYAPLKYFRGLNTLKNVETRYKISKVTGIPLKTLKTVYDRGLAAWRTGHRPGASPQAWAYARVHSFVVKGKTYYTADKNLR